MTNAPIDAIVDEAAARAVEHSAAIGRAIRKAK